MSEEDPVDEDLRARLAHHEREAERLQFERAWSPRIGHQLAEVIGKQPDGPLTAWEAVELVEAALTDATTTGVEVVVVDAIYATVERWFERIPQSADAVTVRRAALVYEGLIEVLDALAELAGLTEPAEPSRTWDVFRALADRMKAECA